MQTQNYFKLNTLYLTFIPADQLVNFRYCQFNTRELSITCQEGLENNEHARKLTEKRWNIPISNVTLLLSTNALIWLCIDGDTYFCQFSFIPVNCVENVLLALPWTAVWVTGVYPRCTMPVSCSHEEVACQPNNTYIRRFNIGLQCRKYMYVCMCSVMRESLDKLSGHNYMYWSPVLVAWSE